MKTLYKLLFIFFCNLFLAHSSWAQAFRILNVTSSAPATAGAISFPSAPSQYKLVSADGTGKVSFVMNPTSGSRRTVGLGLNVPSFSVTAATPLNPTALAAQVVAALRLSASNLDKKDKNAVQGDPYWNAILFLPATGAGSAAAAYEATLVAPIQMAWGQTNDVAITSLNPPNGRPGDAFTISGTALGTAANIVFTGTGTVMAPIIARTATSAIVNIPSGAIDGPVTVQTTLGDATSKTDFVLKRLEPSSKVAGSPGFNLTVYGTGFSATSVVMFGTKAITPTIPPTATTTQLIVPITASDLATAGTIPVTVTNCTPTYSAANFTVLPLAPVMGGLTPATGPVGTEVTITGTNLANATVSFNGTTARPLATSTATVLKVKVPAGATTGPLSITTAGGSVGLITTSVAGVASSTSAVFTVLAAPAAAPAPAAPATVAAVRTAFKEELEKFAAAKDVDEVMAMHFIHSTLNTVDNLGRPVDTVDFDSVEFEVEAGRIVQLYAYTHTASNALKVFTNARTSVSLMNYDGRAQDKLGLYGGGEEYITVGNLYIVFYTSGRRYLPADGHHKLKMKDDGPNIIHLSAGASLATLVEASLYSDLLGLLSKEDNSLVSLELATQIPITTGPFWPNRKYYALQFIRPYASYSRLDSQLDTVRLRGAKADYVDRADLLQRAYFRYGFNLNLLGINNKTPHSVSLNGGWNGAITRVTDGKKDSAGTISERNAYTKTWNLEGVVSFRRLGNFGVDIGANLLWTHIANSQLVTNDGYEKIIKPSALVYFNPRSNPENRIFLRLSSWSFLDHSEKNFFQVQFGYTIGIGSIISSAKFAEPQAVANRASSSALQ